jgi:type VI secretion system Hcp family effector
MPIYIQTNISGRSLNPKGGRLHSMAYGTMAITPRNLNQALSLMQSESFRNMGQLIDKRHHKPLTITKELDLASPQLFNAHWRQEVLSQMVFNFVRPSSGSGVQVAATISLTNGAIVGYKTYRGSVAPPVNHPRHGPMSVHTNELEQFELTFQKITFTNVLGLASSNDDWMDSK